MTAITAAPVQAPVQPRRKHKLINFTQGKVYGLLFGHLGKFSMVAMYFILTQWMHGQTVHLHHTAITLPQVKQTWDHMLDSTVSGGGLIKVLSTSHWTHYRHIVRAFYEGLFGGILYMQMGFDPLKYEQKICDDTPNRFDRFLWKVPGVSNRFKPVTAGQQLMLPVWTFLLGTILAVIFFLTVEPLLYNVLHWHWLEPSLSKHPSWAQKIYNDSYTALILGILSGFLLKRIISPVLNANMMFVCRRWVARGRRPHFWMPMGMRYMIRSLRMHDDAIERNRQEIAVQGKHFALALMFITILLFAASGYGVYILQYIATK